MVYLTLTHEPWLIYAGKDRSFDHVLCQSNILRVMLITQGKELDAKNGLLGEKPPKLTRKTWCVTVDQDCPFRIIPATFGTWSQRFCQSNNFDNDYPLHFEKTAHVFHKRELKYWIWQDTNVFPYVGKNTNNQTKFIHRTGETKEIKEKRRPKENPKRNQGNARKRMNMQWNEGKRWKMKEIHWKVNKCQKEKCRNSPPFIILGCSTCKYILLLRL